MVDWRMETKFAPSNFKINGNLIKIENWKGRLKMITRKSAREIAQMQAAADILVQCHKEIAKMIKPGITTMEIDAFAEEFMRKHGATPEQKGYNGYPYATCASLNDEICHGFPREEKL